MRAGGIKIEMDSLLCKMSWNEGRGRGKKRPRGRTCGVMKEPPPPFLSLSIVKFDLCGYAFVRERLSAPVPCL